MKLFKKTRLYSIVAGEKANLKAQKFADEHGAKNSKIYVQSDGRIVMIDFYSKYDQDYIVKELRRHMGSDFDVKVGDYFIYVDKKGTFDK